MARPCLVCSQAERETIDADLISGKAIPAIIRDHPVLKEHHLQHHKHNHLKPALLEAQLVQDEAAALNVSEQLEILFTRVSKLFAACDTWLTDPEDAGRYSLEPRADEVQVIYLERHGRQTLRKKAALSTLLARLDDAGVVIERVENRSADMRELTLKAARQLQSQTELLAKLQHQLDDSPRILNVVAAPEWLALRSSIIAALSPYPEARQAVIEAIRQHETGAHT